MDIGVTFVRFTGQDSPALTQASLADRNVAGMTKARVIVPLRRVDALAMLTGNVALSTVTRILCKEKMVIPIWDQADRMKELLEEPCAVLL